MIQMGNSNIWIQEMFHGPTGGFKDLSLSIIGGLYKYFLERKNKNVVIYAVKNVKQIDIIVLYPKGRISKVQEQQITCHPENNVHVFAVEGNSYDLGKFYSI